MNEVKNKIKIYESGQCPYCDSKLKSHDHSKMLKDLKEKDNLLTEKILENTGRINHYRDLNTSISNQSRVLESGIDILEEEFIDIKAEAKMLKDKYDNFDEDKTKLINDIKEKGVNLVKSKKEKIERLNEINKDNKSEQEVVEDYTKLKPMDRERLLEKLKKEIVQMDAEEGSIEVVPDKSATAEATSAEVVISQNPLSKPC